MNEAIYDITKRQDRIGMYLKNRLNGYVFSEFSDEFIKKSKAPNSIKGVPIPLRKEDFELFAGGTGVSGKILAENMAYVMGCDPNFKHNDAYREFLLKIFNYKIYEGMLKKGRDAAENENYEYACIQFRATLVMKKDYLHGMYSYARVCRELYMASNDPEYIGRFKAESIEYFEFITELHPRFAQSYYYLGYAYLNMGLYSKADATWKLFTRKSNNTKDIREIKERRKQIEEPIIIEDACNLIAKGSYQQGKDILEKYLDSRFNTWWPLHYYLGLAYISEGKEKKAIESFEKVLSMNPSHLETLNELVQIYKALGNTEKFEKYSNKIKIVKENIATENEKIDFKIERQEKKSLEAKEKIQKKTKDKKTSKTEVKKELETKKPKLKKLGETKNNK